MPYVWTKKYVPMRSKNFVNKKKAPVRRRYWKPRYKPHYRPRQYRRYKRFKRN